ncbi:MAG: hypothetical protein KDB27_07335, partial [Planctomycetales bacterium]|nr:hypothetical protein [Planctomycetales bacterium]
MKPDDWITPLLPKRQEAEQERRISRPPNIPRVHESVSRRAAQLFDDAVKLAERGAAYSARAQLVKALRLFSQALDAETGTEYFSWSLANGLQALEEAADFTPKGAELEAHLNLEQIIGTHKTPVLKDERQYPTPLTAL